MPDKIEAAIDHKTTDRIISDIVHKLEIRVPGLLEYGFRKWALLVGHEAYEAGYRAGLGAEKDENGLKQLTPTPECDCELRNRQWNGYGKCLTCKRRYKAPYPYKQ